MPQAETLTAKQGFAALTQLVDLYHLKGIQRASYRRLIGEALTSPGSGQGDVWPEPTVDL